MEKINIDELTKQAVNGVDFIKMHNEAFIDTSIKLPPPPLALSIGINEYNGYPSRFATFGNFSCLVGGSKAKKTFLKSLMMAGFIGGNVSEYAPNLRSHRQKDMFVIDLDTEQSDWDAQRVFRRVESLIGGSYEMYKPFYLRKYTAYERLQFIEWIILESEYRNNLGMISIDGIADLIEDVNDLKKSNEITGKLLNWTDTSKCHIITVLHKNFDSKKPTGHLGSSVLKKAETVAMIDKDEVQKEYSNVNFDDYTRGGNIDNFSFYINKFGLPVIEK